MLFRNVIVICFVVLGAAFAVAEPVNVGPGVQPRVVSHGDRVAVVFGRPGEILIATSADAGKTFEKPRSVATVSKMPLGMRRGPRVVMTEKTMVITAIEGEQGGGKDGDVVAWVSTDAGKTWQKAKKPLNEVAGAAREGLHGMAANAAGVVAVAWLDLRNSKPGAPGTELWLSISRDGGLTWEKDHLAYRHPQGTICECCHPSVAVDPSGAIHLMFRHAKDGARDMYVTTSKDEGATFPEPQKLGNGTWMLKACPMDGGELAIDAAGKIQTAWMRKGESFICVPGEDEKPLGAGKQPILSITPKRTWLTWCEGKAVVGMWSDGKKETLAPDGGFPTSATVGEDAVIIAWQQKEGIFVERKPLP